MSFWADEDLPPTFWADSPYGGLFGQSPSSSAAQQLSSPAKQPPMRRLNRVELLQPESADGAFADAAEVKSSVVFDGIRDFGVTVRRRVLQILNYLAIHVESDHEAVTLRGWLNESWQTLNNLSEERMRLQFIERVVARRDQR